jgi:hypothetical protein
LLKHQYCYKRKSVQCIQEDESIADQGNQVNNVIEAKEILPKKQLAKMSLSTYAIDDTFEITDNVCIAQDLKGHELMTIPVVMNGIKLKALIDSGASHSILSFDVVKEHNVEFVATKTKVMMGNGSFDYTYGSVVNAKVDVMNTSHNLTLWILPNPIQLLLGADWLYLTGATINIRHESLSFPDNSYHMVNACQIFEETAVEILVEENYQGNNVSLLYFLLLFLATTCILVYEYLSVDSLLMNHLQCVLGSLTEYVLDL